MAQRIKDEDVESLDERPRLIRHAAAIGQVGEVAEAKAEDLSRAVDERHRLKADGADVERAGDGVELNLRQPAALVGRRVEHVEERAPQALAGGGVGITGNRALLHLAEAARIVQAHDVIGVAVREHDRVDAADALLQRLLAQIGRGVDEDLRAVFDVDEIEGRVRRVARIGRAAHRAPAADHRHAVRSAAAQDGDVRLHQKIEC